MANQRPPQLMFVIAQQKNPAPRVQQGKGAAQHAGAIWPVIHQIAKLDDEKAKRLSACNVSFARK